MQNSTALKGMAKKQLQNNHGLHLLDNLTLIHHPFQIGEIDFLCLYYSFSSNSSFKKGLNILLFYLTEKFMMRYD
jgi:hypothetical protein